LRYFYSLTIESENFGILEDAFVSTYIDSGFDVSTAGLIFLVASLADVVTGLFFLWFPKILFE
jgi:hypothetical protein